MPYPAAIPVLSPGGAWYIQHRYHPTLAFTGKGWTHHTAGYPANNKEIRTFANQQEAQDYINNWPAKTEPDTQNQPPQQGRARSAVATRRVSRKKPSAV